MDKKKGTKEYRTASLLLPSTKTVETPKTDYDDELILKDEQITLNELIEQTPNVADESQTPEDLTHIDTISTVDLEDTNPQLPVNPLKQEEVIPDTNIGTQSMVTKPMTIEGIAVLFNQKVKICTIDGVDYFEIIDEHAFDDVDLSDVVCRYNHNDGFSVLARTRNNSLRLFVDNEGLKFQADIVDTQQGRDIYKLIQEGLVTACSFGFIVKEDYFDPYTNTRRILKFERVFEISLVDIPAYDNTIVRVSERDYFSAMHEIQQVKEKEERRKRLILLTY